MSKSSKSTSSIDSYTQGLQRQNYQSAQDKFSGASYRPVTGEQIQGYMSPYTTSVIDAALGDNDRSRMMARNDNTDAAIKAGAFGGTGVDVANSLTEGEYDRNAQSLIASLRDRAYTSAAGMAQEENTAEQNYPLLIQQLLNGTLAGVTPNVTQKTKTKDPMGQWSSFLQGAGSAAQGFAAL